MHPPPPPQDNAHEQGPDFPQDSGGPTPEDGVMSAPDAERLREERGADQTTPPKPPHADSPDDRSFI